MVSAKESPVIVAKVKSKKWARHCICAEPFPIACLFDCPYLVLNLSLLLSQNGILSHYYYAMIKSLLIR
jgi:hypothetical protein